MLMIPLYFKLKDGVVSSKVYIPVGAIIIATVVALAALGYALKILSAFAIFTIVMFMLSIGFMAGSIALALAKINKQDENPEVYCAYGETHYRF